MKDALIQKVTPIPSCLADSSETAGKLPVTAVQSLSASNEGYRRVRRSAAMIGLAISMSATSSMLLPNQNDSAMATESVALDPTYTSLPTTTPAKSDPSQPASKAVYLSPPAIKHEVRRGESLWQLSQDYQVPPEAIAASNNLAPKANILVGQTLKIPPVNEEKGSPNDPVVLASQVDRQLQDKQNQSLDQLKEARQQLKNSLAQLRSEESQQHSNLTEVAAQVSAVPQPSPTLEASATSSSATALSPEWSETQAIEIPVPAPETGTTSTLNRQPEAELKHPIPIATATPATDTVSSTSKQATTRAIGTEPISVPLPQAATFPTSRRQEANKSNTTPSISVPSLRPQETANPDRPVPIAVPSPETASVHNYQPQETEITSPKPSENQQPKVNTTLPPLEISQPRVVTPASNQEAYQVKPGDTLNSIARRHGLSPAELIEANNLRNPNLIKINQQLIIPKASVASRPTPTLIAGNSVPVVKSQLSGAPVPIVTAAVPPSMNGNVRADIQTQALNQPNQAIDTLEIPVQTPTNTYTEKLKDDIVKLQQEYRAEPVSNPAAITEKPQPIAVELNTQTAVNANTRNPEWDSDRRQPRVKPRYQPQAQVVGAAPTSAATYNDMLGTSVGEMVGPDLPPLSVPEQYLPDSPTRFNGYVWPTKGVITSGFGMRWGRPHKGIDIAAPIGTPVMAAASGEVVSAGWNSGGYGNLVKIQHPDGSVTFYAHNNRILVRQGQKVEQGEQISEMGTTGYST
ncbi:MAG: LysM peptidoglycan-binding domain-containing protein, partial [Microcystaceae cyanobacterium]